MFARCTIRRYEKAGALTVPMDAGAEVDEKTLRLFHRGLAKPRPQKTVDILFMDEGQVEVGGLAENDLVVLTPGAEMRDGALLNVMDVFDPRAHVETSTAPAAGCSSRIPADPAFEIPSLNSASTGRSACWRFTPASPSWGLRPEKAYPRN
ncbi:MAG: hypothetical protein IPN23_07780 [Elusimicrobia bacterium]|nr:hypothetical protein [Elusimicrobiota bacterium]